MHVNEGLTAVLRGILKTTIFNQHVKLFKAPSAPDEDTVLADLVEPTFTGYAEIVVSSVTWPNPTINGSSEAESDSPTITWTCTTAPGSPETILGVAIVIDNNLGGNAIWWIDLLPTPRVITDVGDDVKVKLNFFAKNY